jgi:hypothetical protein
MLLVLPVGSQDLGGISLFDQPAATLAAADSAAPSESGDAPSTSAHYALLNVDSYLTTLTARFSVRERTLDPFGLNVDPTTEVAPATDTPRAVAVQAAPRTPFVDIVNSIRVTAVMPSDKQFLVGSRTIREGDVLPLAIPEGTIRVRVLAVRADGILFENLEDQSTATLRSQLMPKGMSRGADGIKVLGMQPDSPTAPLKVDVQIMPSAPAPR